MPKHFIAGNGSYGCLYDSCEVFETKTAAVDHLVTVFDLGSKRKEKLRKNEYIDLGPEFGADYAEITVCNCDEPKIHSDSDG